MFRYSYKAYISQYTKDDNGDIISQTQYPFDCDYQPNSNNFSINVGGTNIPVAYILFVPKKCTIDFEIGTDISCNNSNGTVALSVPFKFGKIIYVKG